MNKLQDSNFNENTMKRIFEKILNQEINESQQRHKNRQLMNEALTQKQKREVLDYIKENSFFPLIDGKHFYFIVPVDDEHLKMEPEFKNQLKREGYYKEYCISGIISSEAAKLPIDVSRLPIHGSSDKFDTKWFAYTYNDCFAKDLRDRIMKLSKRLDIDEIM